MSTADAGPVFTLATGPVGSTPATQAALAQPVLHHTDPAFRALYAETVALLREAFGTSVDPVIFPGEAVVGIEAAAAALIGPDDVVLNVVSGIYGKAFGQLAGRFAREVIEVETAYNASIAPAAVSEALARRADVTIVAVVHCETPSGTMNDLDAIGRDSGSSGALLIVDAVSSFGGMRTDVENWPGIAITAPQKALGGTPGLSLLHVSDDAWRHIAANPNAPRGSALSILDWRDAHRPDRAFPFTPPVSEIYGLRSVPAAVPGRRPARTSQRRHRRAARAVRAGARALGLSLWAAEDAHQGRHRHRDRDASRRGRGRGPRGGAGRVGGDAGRGAGRAQRASAADRAHGAGRVPDEPGDRADRARPRAAQARGQGGHRRRGGGGAGRLG